MRETNQEELQGLNEVNNVGPLLTRNACNEIVVQSHSQESQFLHFASLAALAIEPI